VLEKVLDNNYPVFKELMDTLEMVKHGYAKAPLKRKQSPGYLCGRTALNLHFISRKIVGVEFPD